MTTIRRFLPILFTIGLFGCSSLNAPSEIPRPVQVEVSPGIFKLIKVYPLSCYKSYTGAYADIPTNSVFLCGQWPDLEHELAHHRGMGHTAWKEDQYIGCAIITTAGYHTKYKLGDRICMRRDTRYEWIEKGD